MKKILTLFVFGAALLFIAPAVQAQSTDKVARISKEETTTLAKEMNLTQNEQDLVFRQLYAYNYNTSMNKKGSENYEANKEKYDSSFKENMKEVLNTKQYATFQEMRADLIDKKVD